jgi:hypothetical protein
MVREVARMKPRKRPPHRRQFRQGHFGKRESELHESGGNNAYFTSCGASARRICLSCRCRAGERYGARHGNSRQGRSRWDGDRRQGRGQGNSDGCEGRCRGDCHCRQGCCERHGCRWPRRCARHRCRRARHRPQREMRGDPLPPLLLGSAQYCLTLRRAEGPSRRGRDLQPCFETRCSAALLSMRAIHACDGAALPRNEHIDGLGRCVQVSVTRNDAGPRQG